MMMISLYCLVFCSYLLNSHGFQQNLHYSLKDQRLIRNYPPSLRQNQHKTTTSLPTSLTPSLSAGLLNPPQQDNQGPSLSTFPNKWGNSPFPLFSKISKGLFFLFFNFFFLSFPKPALAKDIFGWDLYGRVPYDDFLFSTGNLLNKNLFKRTFVETVAAEIPYAYNAFKRRMILSELVGGTKTFVKFVAVCAMVAIFLKFRPTQVDNLKDQFTQIRGFDTPLSAKLKKKK